MQPATRPTVDPSTLPTVRASVQFTKNTGATPVALVAKPGEGEDTRLETVFEPHEIDIHDGRPIADQFDLDRQGFALRQYDTAVRDFFDDDEVRRVYYPEMERLIAAATGADKVLVFDHTIRIQDPELQAKRKVRMPVSNVHNDFTTKSAPARVRDLLPPDEAEARLEKRFGSVNVWRPIVGPVENRSLVICGWQDLKDESLIAAERHYGDRIGGVYNLAYDADQTWYYFSRMQRGEVVLLKCYDSLTDGTARWTCHGSFDEPDAPADAKPRQSIEVRLLMFWD